MTDLTADGWAGAGRIWTADGWPSWTADGWFQEQAPQQLAAFMGRTLRAAWFPGPNRPTPYMEVFMSVGEKLLFGCDWEERLELRWPGAGRTVSSGVAVRPSQPNGFQYLCSVAGLTGGAEPTWPPTVGATVDDGSVEWTCEAAGVSSLETTVADSEWLEVDGIDLSNDEYLGQVAQVIVDTTDAIAPCNYDLVNQATMANGEIEKGIIRIKVR